MRGRTRTVEEWACWRGMIVETLVWRLEHGWEAPDAVLVPVHPAAASVVVTAFGRTLTPGEWERENGVPATLIGKRIKLGWTPEGAVSRPVRSKRTARTVTVGGETLAVHEWSERTGIPAAVISSRLSIGWTPERAVSEPIRKRRGTGRRGGRHRRRKAGHTRVGGAHRHSGQRHLQSSEPRLDAGARRRHAGEEKAWPGSGGDHRRRRDADGPRMGGAHRHSGGDHLQPSELRLDAGARRWHAGAATPGRMTRATEEKEPAMKTIGKAVYTIICLALLAATIIAQSQGWTTTFYLAFLAVATPGATMWAWRHLMRA